MQQLNPSEISDLIKQRIDQLEVASQATNEGTIVSVTDGIIRIHGLTEVQYGEMIEFEGGVFGLALNLERDSVGAVVLGDYKQLAEARPADVLAAFSRCRLGQSCRDVWWTHSVTLSMARRHRNQNDRRDREDCTRRHCSTVSGSASPDWPQGD